MGQELWAKTTNIRVYQTLVLPCTNIRLRDMDTIRRRYKMFGSFPQQMLTPDNQNPLAGPHTQCESHLPNWSRPLRSCRQTRRRLANSSGFAVPRWPITWLSFWSGLEKLSRPSSKQVAWPTPQVQQHSTCWSLETSRLTWTLFFGSERVCTAIANEQPTCHSGLTSKAEEERFKVLIRRVTLGPRARRLRVNDDDDEVPLSQYLSSVTSACMLLAVSTRPPDGVLLPPAAPRLLTGAVIRRRFAIVR